MISFIIFDATTLKGAFGTIGGLFGAGGVPLISQSAIYYLKSYSLIFVMAIVGATPIPKYLYNKINQSGETAKNIMNIVEILFVGSLFILIVAYLIDGSFNPFLYFRF